MKSTYTADFSEIRMGDMARVGGKNASLQGAQAEGRWRFGRIRDHNRCVLAAA
jgi:hypothetical protein